MVDVILGPDPGIFSRKRLSVILGLDPRISGPTDPRVKPEDDGGIGREYRAGSVGFAASNKTHAATSMRERGATRQSSE